MRGMLLAFALTIVCAVAERLAPLEITVQVYNHSSATMAEVRRGIREASWILETAGVRVRWVECAPLAGPPPPAPLCAGSTAPHLFELALLPRRPPDHSVSSLGFAELSGIANYAAAIYPAITALLHHNPECRNSGLLGAVFAHELGHLILRSRQHGSGIMQSGVDY